MTEIARPEDACPSSTEEQRAERARERVLAAVRDDHSLRSANAVSRAAGGNRTANLEMVRELLEEGALRKVSGTFRVVLSEEDEP